MSKLFKWASACFAAAIAFALPLAAMAVVDYTGTDYAPWSYSAGCVAWRATESLFHSSTVVEVPADGVIVEENAYAFGTGHPWQVFASNQTAYSAPGMVLVYDVAGKTAATDAQFAPLSFGGMWVKVLQAEGVPYSITDNKTDGSDRKVELGAAGASTYFKFDESFTFNRNSATKVLGTATVEIANGKTFTINARANKGAAVDAGNTLVLKGAGTLAVVGGLSVDGTLDLSAATRPSIDGDVTLAGTIVLPANTEVSSESPFTVCSGTLSGVNVNVKIGDAEPVEKSFTASNGAITSFGDPVYVFTEDYPTVVPAGKTYTFVGGDSAENAVVLDALDVRGTLKTQGYFSFTNYKSGGAAAVLDVETGSLTLSPGNNWFNGTLTVEAGATFVNAMTDAVQYGGSFTANIYGTLTMGATRWSLGSNNTLNFHEGCTVTGSGDGNNGTFDWIENATGTLNVDGDVNLAAPIRIRSTATVNVNVDTTDQKGLMLAGTIGAGKIVKKGAGLVKFTTNPPYAITVENGAFTFAVDATPTITYSAKPGTGTSMSMWYATQSTWKGTVIIGVLSAPANIPLGSYGNENSKIVLKGTTGSSYLSGGTIASELVIDTADGDAVEFNNGSSGQVVTFTKVSGSGTLKLVGWTGCSSATYNFTTLDNFTGLAVHNAITRNGGGTFTIGIGNIVTSNSTAAGACVLPIAKTAVEGATGTVAYNLASATLNGEAADLEEKADGIYVVVPVTMVNITVPVVNGATATVTVGGEPVEPTTAGGNSYSVAEGSTVTVTYAANEGYELSGTTTYTIDSAAEGSTFTITDTQTAAYVAALYTASTVKYTTLQAAVTAATETRNSKIVLLASTEEEAATIPAVASAKFYVVANGNACGTISNPTGDYIVTTSADTIDIDGVGEGLAATVYSVIQAAYAVTPNGGERTLYDVTEAEAASYAAVMGGIGSTLEFVNGTDDSSYVELLEGAGFVKNMETGVWTFTTMPVAVVTHGVSQTPYLTLAAAVAGAESGDTITLIGDDSSSFSASNLEIAIAKALTINGGGFTIYGVNDYAGPNDHDIYISGSGDVTISNVTLANFGGAVPVSGRTYPIWTGQAYTGTLTLDNVTVRNFNRTAFNLNGGTVVVKNCTISGDTTKETYFQEGIGVYNANVTIVNTAISNVGSNYEKVDSQVAGCIQLGNPNGSTVGTGSITVVDGTYSGEYGIIVASNAQNSVSVQGGTFTGDLMVEEGEGGSIAISGGTFSAEIDPAFCAEGYEPTDDGNGHYTVRIDLGWIYEAADHPNYTGSWTTPVTYDETTQKITIEGSNTYSPTTPSAGRYVTVTTTLSFDGTNDSDDDVADAKAAIRLGNGEGEGTYVFQVCTTGVVEGVATQVWENASVSVEPAVETDYTFAFVLDLTNKTYTVSLVDGTTTNALSVAGSETIAFAYQGEVTPVHQMDFVGAGTVTSIFGEFEDPEVVLGFVDGQLVGEVTLTAEQAEWLNGQNSYGALADKIAAMTSAAFARAYLLNLDVLSDDYDDDDVAFAVTGIEVGTTTVKVTVALTRPGALAGGINGTLKLKGGAALPASTFGELQSVEVDDGTFATSDEAECTFTKGEGGEKFFQPVIE